MSEYDDDQEFEETEDDSVQLTKAQFNDLQAKARSSKKQAEELATSKAAARELAFVKAGVDTDSSLGKLLMKAYDGELTAEGIRAEAMSIGLIETPTDPEPTPDEKASTEERQQLASDSPPDVPPVPDPVAQALKEGEDAMAAGASQEDAIGLAFRSLLLHGDRVKSGDSFNL